MSTAGSPEPSSQGPIARQPPAGGQPPARRYEERAAAALPGLSAAALAAAAVIAAVVLIVAGAGAHASALVVVGAVLAALAAVAVPGFVVVAPNESRVLLLFGNYVGTIRTAGIWWVNPFTALSRFTVSLRVRNFQGNRIKVNDASGNPIELAAVVVWRVVDTARALLEVEEFEQFVVVQSETAVRHIANLYPYDDYTHEAVSLRRDTDEVLKTLHAELEERLRTAGIDVLETRLTHLAYASEIAEAMLRRQQAEAIVAARRTMVAGAVGMVEIALEQLESSGAIELDAERKAAMVSNLMVVLSGDHAPTPVINTGSLYT